MTFYDHHQSLRIPRRNLRHENICIIVKKCLAFNLQRRIKIRLKTKFYNTFIIFRTLVHLIYYWMERNQMPVSWNTIFDTMWKIKSSTGCLEQFYDKEVGVILGSLFQFMKNAWLQILCDFWDNPRICILQKLTKENILTCKFFEVALFFHAKFVHMHEFYKEHQKKPWYLSPCIFVVLIKLVIKWMWNFSYYIK